MASYQSYLTSTNLYMDLLSDLLIMEQNPIMPNLLSNLFIAYEQHSLLICLFLCVKLIHTWFFEARKTYCGPSLLEVAELCNLTSIETCVDASKYVFHDSLHPTQAMNKFLMHHLIPPATFLIYSNQTLC
jgi:hypothetical protein